MVSKIKIVNGIVQNYILDKIKTEICFVQKLAYFSFNSFTESIRRLDFKIDVKEKVLPNKSAYANH